MTPSEYAMTEENSALKLSKYQAVKQTFDVLIQAVLDIYNAIIEEHDAAHNLSRLFIKVFSFNQY